MSEARPGINARNPGNKSCGLGQDDGIIWYYPSQPSLGGAKNLFFNVKAWQDCSGPGQDDGIILGIIFFWAGQLGHWQPEPASSTWYYFIPGRLLTLPGQALDRY